LRTAGAQDDHPQRHHSEDERSEVPEFLQQPPVHDAASRPCCLSQETTCSASSTSNVYSSGYPAHFCHEPYEIPTPRIQSWKSILSPGVEKSTDTCTLGCTVNVLALMYPPMPHST